jgi:ornithine--oxo-acid transaminase
VQGLLSKETHQTVIRFAPPLTISRELVDRAVAIFHQVAAQRYQELGLGKKPSPVRATV